MSFIQWLKNLLGLNPTPETLTRKAGQMAHKENFHGAVEIYKQVLGQDPLYIPAYEGLGRVYFRMSLREESDREFAIADGLDKLRTNPDDLDSAINMGKAMLAKGLSRQTILLLEPILQRNQKNLSLLKIMGLAYKAAGNDKRARDILRIVLAKRPKDQEIYLQLGSLEAKSGEKEEGERLIAIGRLMGFIEIDPLDAASRYELARIFFAGGKYSEAADYGRQAVAINKNNADFWTFLGECYFKAGLMPAAADSLKQAVKLAPAEARPQKLLGQVLQFMGRFDESRQVKQVAAVLEGGQSETQTPQASAKFIKYLLSIGQFDKARSTLEMVLEKWPDSHELRLIQGRILVKDKKYEQAVEVLRIVAQDQDTWAEPHIWMALAYQQLGDKMQALAEGQLATRLAPKSHVIHKIYGDILREQKKFGMAEDAYETAEHLKAQQKSK